MSELRKKLLRLTELRYETFPQLLDSLAFGRPDDLGDAEARSNPARGDPVAQVLKCHLLSEVALDKLLTLALEPNGEAVLSAGLTYAQKLKIASQSLLAPEWELVPDYVIGSLRKLNRIRNRLAHELGATVARQEILDLFMGIDHPMQLDVETADVALLLSHYRAFIFGSLLPKYELLEEEKDDL